MKKQIKEKCNPDDVALKSYFLGPQAENGSWVKGQIGEVLERWFDWRKSLYPQDGQAISEEDQHSKEFGKRRDLFSQVIFELVGRFESEVPKHSPRYIGHMFSEQSLPALFGHIVALIHNPNNISSESSRVGVKIENEAIEELLKMIGIDPQAGAGHFTSGGTVANFEALLRARLRCAHWLSMGAALDRNFKGNIFDFAHMGWEQFEKLKEENQADRYFQSELQRWNFVTSNPWMTAILYEKHFKLRFKGPVVLVPENKHYSWKKGVSMLGLGDEAFWPIRLDKKGKLSLPHLQELILRAQAEMRPILMVVSVAGTTELGAFDPVHEVQDLLDEWKKKFGIHLWHHVDAAYGGFFCTMNLDNPQIVAPIVAQALCAIKRVNSVTLDPHKLGYVPYSSGAFLTGGKRDYAVATFDSPYIEFDKAQDRGAYTIEGSRSAAGAVATWMTAKCFGLSPDGHGRILARTIQIRKNLEHSLLEAGLNVRVAPFAESNVLCFTLAAEGESLAISNQRTLQIYREFSPKGESSFFVSKTVLNWSAYGAYLQEFVSSWKAKQDCDEVVLVRLCLMNPFFDSQVMKTDFSQHFITCLHQALKKNP